MTVLVTLHSLHHALCLVQIQLIVLALHNVFLRRVLLVQVTQTLSTDASTVVLMVLNIGILQKSVSCE